MPSRTPTAPIPEPVAYPPAPPGLSPEEKVLWKVLLHSKPSDWFDGGNLHLLGALTRHITSFDAICREMERFDISNEEHLDVLNKLMLMRDRESKAMSALSGKLRLTLQSRYTPMAARTAAMRGARAVRPWEEEEPVNVFANNGRQPR